MSGQETKLLLIPPREASIAFFFGDLQHAFFMDADLLCYCIVTSIPHV